MFAFLQSRDSYTLCYLKITPGSKRQKFAGTTQDERGQTYLKLAVSAPPEKGKANQSVLRFLSKKLELPLRVFSIHSGDLSAWKCVLIQASLEEVNSRFLPLLESQ